MGARKGSRRIIHFLDLGSGSKAERGSRHAERHKEHHVVSVDRDSPEIPVDQKGRVVGQRHHSYVTTDAFEYLRRRTPDSVEVANDEFFLDEVLLKHQVVAALRASDINEEMIPQVAGEIRGKMGEYAGAVRRVLTPGGRVSVMLQGFFKAALAEELRRQGLQVSERILTRDEVIDGDSGSARRALRDFDKMRAKYSEPVGFRLLAPALGHQADVSADVLASTFVVSATKPGGKKRRPKR